MEDSSSSNPRNPYPSHVTIKLSHQDTYVPSDKKEAQERKAEELHAAILNQDFGNVIDILDEGVVTLRDKITISSNTALHVAVGTGRNRKFLARVLNLATRENQQLDMPNSEGSTLLHIAAIVGNTEAAKMLVERNQDLLFEKDSDDRTPLDRALSNMHTDTYMYLLDEYLKFQHLERDALFGSSEFLVNAISSKDYDSALKIAKLIRDPDTVLTAIDGTVLTAIAHNFPPELDILESMSLQGKLCKYNENYNGLSKQDNGIPVFANIPLFTLFAISDVISFFTSVASLLMFLSIVTDSYTEQNFLIRLPSKLIIGLFALVKNLISATYGRSMFGKKSNAPFY
ncbi:hypothetical protein E3N88_07670 [Mikania micrantha]|uniref:PGG domain-containing protein n=1 Tax=Mikania micrantha TaxID=192012 RepID=A0A5N6PH60_9ASTR|nr:hypothetical protein E3N88_07670 [Mikania micrantha]